MTLQVVGTMVGISTGMLSAVMVVFGRMLKRNEKRAVARDEAINVMVQHFDPKSELSVRTGGTLPDKVYKTADTVGHLEQVMIADIVDRVGRVEQKANGLGERLSRIEKS